MSVLSFQATITWNSPHGHNGNCGAERGSSFSPLSDIIDLKRTSRNLRGDQNRDPQRQRRRRRRAAVPPEWPPPRAPGLRDFPSPPKLRSLCAPLQPLRLPSPPPPSLRSEPRWLKESSPWMVAPASDARTLRLGLPAPRALKARARARPRGALGPRTSKAQLGSSESFETVDFAFLPLNRRDLFACVVLCCVSAGWC